MAKTGRPKQRSRKVAEQATKREKVGTHLARLARAGGIALRKDLLCEVLKPRGKPSLTHDLKAHTGPVMAVAISRCGNFVASAGWDQTARLYDVGAGMKFLMTFKGHTDYIYGVAFTPDSEYVVTASFDHTLKVFDRNTGECVRTLVGHTDAVRAVSVANSPPAVTASAQGPSRGRLGHTSVASASYDNTARIFSLDGRCTQVLEGHSKDGNPSHYYTCHGRSVTRTSGVLAVSFSRDGRVVATGAADKTVRLHDVGTGAFIRAFTGHADWVRTCLITPNSRSIVTGSRDGTARRFDIRTGDALTIHQGAEVLGVAVDEACTLLAICTTEYRNNIWLYELQTGKHIRTLEGHVSGTNSISMTPDGSLLASGGDDRTVKLWSTAGECKASVGLDLRGVEQICLLGGDNRLAVCDDGGAVRMYDLKAGSLLDTCCEQGYPTPCIAAETSGGRFAAGRFKRTETASEGSVRVWGPAEAGGVAPPPTVCHPSSSRDSHLNPAGTRVILTGSDCHYNCHVDLYDTATKEPLMGFVPRTWSSVALLSADDTRVVIAVSNVVKVLDAWTGLPLVTWRGKNAVRTLLLNFSNTLLVAGDADGVVTFLDAGTGAEIRAINAHPGGVRATFLSADESLLVSGGNDCRAHLFDAVTGRLLRSFEGHTEPVVSVVLTRDNKRVATASGDHSIRFWNVETGELLGTFWALDKGVLWTTPPEPDQDVPSGWFFTDRQGDLIHVVHHDEEGRLRAVAPNDPDFEPHCSEFNTATMTMARINDPAEYRELLRVYNEGRRSFRDAASMQNCLRRLMAPEEAPETR
jgi:WD40 repeat protein